MTDDLRDVVAVNLCTGRVRVIAVNETPKNAEAIVEMAVIRRGVNVEFFADVPRGTHKDGDAWGEKP